MLVSSKQNCSAPTSIIKSIIIWHLTLVSRLLVSSDRIACFYPENWPSEDSSFIHFCNNQHSTTVASDTRFCVMTVSTRGWTQIGKGRVEFWHGSRSCMWANWKRRAKVFNGQVGREGSRRLRKLSSQIVNNCLWRRFGRRTRFPEIRLQHTETWQPRKVFYKRSWFSKIMYNVKV